jgi:hypothetical protein
LIKTPFILKADITLLEDGAATLKRFSATGREQFVLNRQKAGHSGSSCAIVQQRSNNWNFSTAVLWMLFVITESFCS